MGFVLHPSILRIHSIVSVIHGEVMQYGDAPGDYEMLEDMFKQGARGNVTIQSAESKAQPTLLLPSPSKQQSEVDDSR